MTSGLQVHFWKISDDTRTRIDRKFSLTRSFPEHYFQIRVLDIELFLRWLVLLALGLKVFQEYVGKPQADESFLEFSALIFQ